MDKKITKRLSRDTSYMDISKLAENIKSYKIIGIGEATHGQLKLNEFRNKLVKKMVTKYNFRVIVIEDQYSCVKIIDKYIKNKDVIYLDGLDAFPFQSKTFVSLLKWLRNYNIKNNNKISIIGIDCQYTCPKYKSKSEINKYVNTLIKKLNKIPYSNSLKSLNFRDKCMYEIFMKQYNKNKKYLIFAHNGHLQKEPYNKDDKIKWFGNYLYNKFDSDYCAIGNTFYTGKYLATNIDNNYKVGIANINVKKKLNSGIFYINKNDIIEIYDGDVTYSSKNPNKTFYKNYTNNRFNILIVINNELPFTLI